MKKLTIGEVIFQIILIVFMIAIIVITLYPLWYVFVASLSNASDVIKANGRMLWISGFNIDAYKEVFKNKNIWTGYVNTIFVVGIGTFLSLLLTALGGYFLSRKDVMWKGVIAVAIVFTMYFSGGMIPRYFVVRELHLNNSLFALILPVAISTYNLIIMRTAFASLPQALSEAAEIDGAGHITILFRIMLPLCGSTLAVLALYYAVSYWNSWFDAMIFIDDRSKFPLQLILREIVMYNTTSDALVAVDNFDLAETVQYATIIVATLPILIIYPLIQKYFEKGVMIGAIKE